MKRTAILLCGHLRTYDKTTHSFINAFSELDYDVFCHTWDTKGHNSPVWWSENGDNNNEPVTNIDTNNLRVFYKPKKLVIEKQNQFISANENFKSYKGYNSVKNMWETVWHCNQLRLQYEKEANIHYDCILKTRYDIIYDEVLNSRILEENLSKYKFNFIYTQTSKIENVYSDSIFYASPENFDLVIDSMKNRVDDFLYASIEKFKVIEGEASFTEFLRKEFGTDEDYNRFLFKCRILRFNGASLPLYPG